MQVGEMYSGQLWLNILWTVGLTYARQSWLNIHWTVVA